MWERWKRQRELRTTARKMADARRRGEGVYTEEWSLPEGTHHSAMEPILEWCRDVVGRCRRPFGIDEFDLALSFRQHEASHATSQVYRITARDLYDESTIDQLAAFLFGQPAQPVYVVAALFSWGDAAHAALPDRR